MRLLGALGALGVVLLLSACGTEFYVPSWGEMSDSERRAYCENLAAQYDSIDWGFGTNYKLQRRMTARLERCVKGGYLS